MYSYIKRLLDFSTSLVLIIVLLPVILFFFVFLKLVNGGSAFFIQRRPGKNENIFKIIKFKTMTDEKDENGQLLPDKERITKIGSFVRKTSIDEIPQLFNILKGDMSFIGPRPLLEKYLPFYNEFERKRHLVRPGITGLSQVNGRNFIMWVDRIKLDVEYAANRTFLKDAQIVLQTIRNVINRKDIQEVPSEMGRVTLDVRRDPKNNGLYDENGLPIKKAK
jgi:undecaprenyl phosphate N,N'-diacetylbacillosamine 1-phosphate transferase